MPARKKTELTAKVSGVIANGQGGFYREGTKFEPGEGADPESLKARGLAE